MCGGKGGLQTAIRKPKHDISETLQSGSNLLHRAVRDMFTVHLTLMCAVYRSAQSTADRRYY